MVANRILGNEGVVDAFGHISVRHPENAGRYFLACSRSPGLVAEEDIVEFDLDSNRLDDTDRAIYAERFIHGCIYKARPDVMSVCHSHAHAVVPFTVTNAPIEPIWVMSSGSGAGVPNWDIRDEFPNEGTMLVVNDATGRSLAKHSGNGRVCLLRGHGAVIATGSLKATVMVSIGLMCNAQMLIQAHSLSQGRGDAAVKHLSPAEIEATAKFCSARSVSIAHGNTGGYVPVSRLRKANVQSESGHWKPAWPFIRSRGSFAKITRPPAQMSRIARTEKVMSPSAMAEGEELGPNILRCCCVKLLRPDLRN